MGGAGAGSEPIGASPAFRGAWPGRGGRAEGAMAGGAGRPGPGPGEPLCCCEYVARGGERAHLVAVLCDCQDLDEGCDR